MFFHLPMASLASFFRDLSFSLYRLVISFVKFIPRILIFLKLL
jgi:hypothetical protein